MKYDTYSSRTHTNGHKHSRRARHRVLNVIFNPLTMFITAAVILIFSIGLRTVNASAENEKTMYRYYTSITVQSDDTLWDIANRYAYNEKSQSYVSNIKKINNMSDSTIYSGQDIIIYYYSDELK
jgi:nucleoid-associated protein YgaU